jgi:hypothetical protein
MTLSTTDNNKTNESGIPVFMIGRSAENGKEILPALAPDFDSTTAPNPCIQVHDIHFTSRNMYSPHFN